MDYNEMRGTIRSACVCINDVCCSGCKYEGAADCMGSLAKDLSESFACLLERVERAEKQLADAGWISVTERLPENDSNSGKIWADRKQYLTINVYGQVEAARFGSGAYEWWCDSHNCIVKDVVFWMPAPKLPKEGE